MINLDDYGGPNIFTWDHDHLVRVLTMGRNPIAHGLYLKNAFKNIRREDFVPLEHRDKAYQDIEISLGFGETLDKPTVIAQMLDHMNPKLGGTYLDIGTGSGWTAALMGYSAGQSGKVYSLERVQFIAELARDNMTKYPHINNVEIILKDGSEGLEEYAQYDGIHIAAAFNDRIPRKITSQLKIGAFLVAPTTRNDLRVIERVSEDQYEENVFQGYFFNEIEEGVA